MKNENDYYFLQAKAHAEQINKFTTTSAGTMSTTAPWCMKKLL